MANQIRIQPEKESLDIVLQLAGWLLMGLTVGSAIYFYLSLPDVVPTHFNLKGEADDHGSKISILLLPIFPVLATVGMNWFSRYPHLFNYPIKITPENALRQYAMATRMIRWMIVTVNLVFLLIILAINQSALEGKTSYGPLLTFGVLSIPVFPLVIYLYKAFRNQAKH